MKRRDSWTRIDPTDLTPGDIITETKDSKVLILVDRVEPFHDYWKPYAIVHGNAVGSGKRVTLRLENPVPLHRARNLDRYQETA